MCDSREKRKENGKIPICTPAMLALKRLRQEDGEFQRNVGTVTHCFPRARAVSRAWWPSTCLVHPGGECREQKLNAAAIP